jgi:hypothetical protein
MIIESKATEFFSNLDRIGFSKSINDYKTVLVKVNFAHPPEKGHPRTDIKLLSDVINYVGTTPICRVRATPGSRR